VCLCGVFRPACGGEGGWRRCATGMEYALAVMRRKPDNDWEWR
jgi:hypothetical protein